MMPDQSARDDYLYMTRHIKTLSPSEWIAQFEDPGDDGYYGLEDQPLPPPLNLTPPAAVIPFPGPAADDQEETGQATAA